MWPRLCTAVKDSASVATISMPLRTKMTTAPNICNLIPAIYPAQPPLLVPVLCRCPPRKGVADFLQEVTSKKDQEQYWAFPDDRPFEFVSVADFAEAFKQTAVGRANTDRLAKPYDRSAEKIDALVYTK